MSSYYNELGLESTSTEEIDKVSCEINQVDFANKSNENAEEASCSKLPNKDDEIEILEDNPINDEEILQRQRNLTMLVAESEETKFVEAYKEKRHVFVLSEAGKPVYSLHGSDDKWLAPLMAVIVALVSFAKDQKDNLRYILAGEQKIVFLSKKHVILVGVSSATESVKQINTHLEYVYDTLISVLTSSRIEQIYSRQTNFDLRRLISDMEIFFTNLCRSLNDDPQFLLEAIHYLPLTNSTREVISQSLQQAKTDDLVFAVLISAGRIVSTCRLKEHILHTKDLQILLNYIKSSKSFNTGETWAPICLPHFNPKGFLHAYISYLDDHLDTCLMLLSADRDSFYKLRSSKQVVVDRLKKYNCLDLLRNTVMKGFYKIEQFLIPDLRHFIYKMKTASQFTCPEFTSPYNEEYQKNRLFEKYQNLHGKVHDPDCKLKLLYLVSDDETMLAWIASGFELYAAFSPLTTKQNAVQSVDKLLKWLKLHEDELFMLKTNIF